MNFEIYFLLIMLFFGVIIIIGTLYYKNITNQNKKILYIFQEIKSIYFLLIIVLVIRLFVVDPFRIPSSSMTPTLLIGDFIFVNKFIYGVKVPIINNNIINIKNPNYGDIIVFKHKSKKNYIKRIIGLPGDKIEYKDKNIYINGILIHKKYKATFMDINKDGIILNIQLLKEYLNPLSEYNIYIHENINYKDYKFKNINIPNNSYFVLGDNRDNSEDSRFWGFVEKKDIVGKAFIKWLSIDFKNKDIRWNRLFSWII